MQLVGTRSRRRATYAAALATTTTLALVLGVGAGTAHAADGPPGPSASPSASPTTTATTAATPGATASGTATPTAPSTTGLSTAPSPMGVSTTPSPTAVGPSTATAAPLAPSTARAATTAGNPAAGAAYLVRQLVGGDHLESTFDGATYANYGGTADLAIALASTGTQDGSLAKVLAYLLAHTADYADPGGTAASFPGPYSGAVGKLAVVAEITGQDPRSFGGFDLISTLTSHVCTAPDTAGNCTAAGDFSQAYSTVSQAFDVLALARAGVEPPVSAVARLEQLQCPDGGFSSTLITAGQTCTSDVDTTGFAVQALALVPAATASVTSATQYLLAQQEADGGFTGAAGENVNSTALVVQALLAAPPVGAPAGAAAAARPRASSSGAIRAGQAYLAASQHASGGFGVHKTDTADDEFATAQAVPAVAGTSLTSLTHAVTPAAAPTSAPTAATTPAQPTA
ncbi:MAG: prenyltransferase/squalene oxidase repeat-containing protein, partial [Mycobacteriales bacterium]